MDRIMSIGCTAVLYEAPHRLERTLRELAQRDGEREIAVCREISKLHEECVVIRLKDYPAFLEEHRRGANMYWCY